MSTLRRVPGSILAFLLCLTEPALMLAPAGSGLLASTTRPSGGSESVFIPAGSGQIVARLDAAGPRVILIEDIHAHAEAQKNVQTLLTALSSAPEDFRPKAILLEGASGAVDLSPFQGMSDKVRSDTLELLLKEGWLSGAEAFAAAHDPYGGTLWGIDDGELYWKNFEAFNRAHDNRPALLRELGRKKEGLLSDLEAAHRPFFEMWDEFAHGGISHGHFSETLFKHAKALRLDIGMTSPLGRYRNMLRAMRRTDERGLQRDYEEILAAITSLAGKEDLKAVVQATLKFRAGRTSQWEYSLGLASHLRRLGISGKRFPHFERYLRLMRNVETMDMAAVDEQMHTLAFEIASLSTRPGTGRRNWAVEWEKILRLEKLAALQWSRSEVLKWQGFRDADFSASLSFYRWALLRDEALARNTLDFLRSRRVDCVAVLMGGFHSEGMREFLKAAGCSYLVVRPRLTSAVNLHRYEDLMMNGADSRLVRTLTAPGRLALPSRLMNALAKIDKVQQFNTMLAVYHHVCAAAQDITSGIKAETFYRAEKSRWLDHLRAIQLELKRARPAGQDLLRLAGITKLIRTLEGYDLDLFDAIRLEDRTYVPLVIHAPARIREPVWVEYMPKADVRGRRDMKDLAEVLEQQELANHTVRFTKAPSVEVKLSELIAGLLSGHNQDMDELVRTFWDGDLKERLDATPDAVQYWDKLVGEFAREVFRQQDRPIVEIISNSVGSLWKRKDVPARVEVEIDEHGFRVKDKGTGMSLRDILSKLLIPGLSGTRGTTAIGQFGVGFFSILRYLSADKSRVTVKTSDGKKAHEITFYMKDGAVVVRIKPLPVATIVQGTMVEMAAGNNPRYEADEVWKTARDAFRYMSRGQIMLNQDVINQDILDFQDFIGASSSLLDRESFLTRTGVPPGVWTRLVKMGVLAEDGTILGRFDGDEERLERDLGEPFKPHAERVSRVLSEFSSGNFFFSNKMASGSGTPGRGRAYVVKDEVVLFDVETEGWSIPEQVVIRVPKFVKIPVERDKIEIGSRERAYFRRLIDAFAAHPNGVSLMSAVYPLIRHIEQWNPSPEKDEDLVRYFKLAVGSLLSRTQNILPDLEEFQAVDIPGVQFLHPELFKSFETYSVKLPPFQKFEDFTPSDWLLKIGLVPFRDPGRGYARFGNLLLISSDLAPSSLLEKAIVYSLLNYHVTEQNMNVPGRFTETAAAPAGSTAVTVDWSRATETTMAPARRSLSLFGSRKETEFFAGELRLVKVILRSLLSVGEGRLAMAGFGHMPAPAQWERQIDTLVDELRTILKNAKKTGSSYSIKPFLRIDAAAPVLMDASSIQQRLRHTLLALNEETPLTQHGLVVGRALQAPEGQDIGLVWKDMTVDALGRLYAFDLRPGPAATVWRFSEDGGSQTIRLQLPDKIIASNAEVSHDGTEFFVSGKQHGVFIYDETGHLKAHIQTGPLGERLSSDSSIEKLSRAGKDALLAWDRRRHAVLVFQRSADEGRWEFVRVIHSEWLAGEGLAGDEAGNVYVLENMDKLVHIYDPLGYRISSLQLPKEGTYAALKLDSNGRLWILDRGRNIVHNYSVTGKSLGDIAYRDEKSGELARTHDISVSPDGELWVSYPGEKVVRKYLRVAPAGRRTMNLEVRMRVLHDIALLGFLDAYLKDHQKGDLIPAVLGRLFRDPERSALIQSWFDMRNLNLSSPQLGAAQQRYVDVFFHLFISDLETLPQVKTASPADSGWVADLSKVLKQSPLARLTHPEDLRYWVAYYRIRRQLSSAALPRFGRYFQEKLNRVDHDNFWKVLKLFETIAKLVETREGKQIFESEDKLKLFEQWLERIGLEHFIQLPPQAFYVLDGRIFDAMKFILKQESQVGPGRFSKFVHLFFKGAFAVRSAVFPAQLSLRKYVEIWEEWLDVPFEELEKDFDALANKKYVTGDREHHFFYLTHDDLDFDRIEEIRPIRMIASSRVISERSFNLSRFFAQFLEAGAAQRDTLLNAGLELTELEVLVEGVSNPLSIEAARSLLRNSVSEQNVDPFVFIREFVQNSLDASRNALAFVIVNAIQDKDLPLDWRAKEARDFIRKKVSEWALDFEQDPEAFIEELSRSSLESSHNAFVFGVAGRILADRISGDWRESAMHPEAARVLNDWISEFNADPGAKAEELLRLASHEALARFVIETARQSGVELALDDPALLRDQISAVVDLSEMRDRFALEREPHPVRIADAVRRKHMEMEVFRTPSNELAMTFTDAVGMNLRQILQFFLLPGVSSKPARDPFSDGRFGIGFFSSFKSATQVEVISSRGKALVSLRFVPERDRDGIVEDVRVTMSVRDNPGQFRGTRILWQTPTQKLPLLAAHLKTKVNEYAGTVSPKELVIRWRKQIVNESLDVIGRRDIPGLGTLTWYLSPAKRNVLTRRGMKVKSLDAGTDIFAQTPQPMVNSILKDGIVIELPRRTPLTRSRDDIASKEQWIKPLQEAFSSMALEAAMRGFLEGSNELVLEMLPYDYMKMMVLDRRYAPKDARIVSDAFRLGRGQLIDMTRYVNRTGTKAEQDAAQTRLVQLIGVLPIIEDPESRARTSLVSMIQRADTGSGNYDAAYLAGLSNRRLASTLVAAFEGRRNQFVKERSAAQALSRPEAAIKNLELPADPVRGFDAYWTFHHWVYFVAKTLWHAVKPGEPIELLYRIEDSGNYAYGGQNTVLFNLYAAAGDIQQWARLLRGELNDNDAIQVLHRFLEAVAHELAHLVEPPGAITHNARFYSWVKYFILVQFEKRGVLQFVLDKIKALNHPGEFGTPRELEPHLVITSRGPKKTVILEDRKTAAQRNERLLQMRDLLGRLEGPERLNTIFRRLSARVMKEAEIPEFKSNGEMKAFLERNPDLELSMLEEFILLLAQQDGGAGEWISHLASGAVRGGNFRRIDPLFEEAA